MRKIDIKKINELLVSNNIKQLELSKHILIKESALSSALNGKRPFPMSYIFEVADFFKANPKDLTISINESITSNKDNNQLQKEKEM
jgi:hypothetical protein